MTEFVMKEKLAKISRIAELADCGLNTPRMLFVKCRELDIYAINTFLNKIEEEDSNQIFNIRTYSRSGDNEGLSCPHICDLKGCEIVRELSSLSNKYHCMIDAETPDGGRYAGNIIVRTNDFGRPFKAYVEYVKKEKRAMVRDIDKEPHFSMEVFYFFDADPVIEKVMKEALKFSKKEVILEWTYFEKKAGVKRENLVFWEYRAS